MAFYTYRQNNSSGRYKGPSVVVVEERSASRANYLAESYGVYFDGVSSGRDCACCGSRWYRVDEDDAMEAPGIYSAGDLAARELGWWVEEGDGVLIVYADGRTEERKA